MAFTMSKLVPASSPPAGPSKATLPPHTSGQTPGPCAFKGVQACRLPGLKPQMLPQAFPKPISPPAGPSTATLPLNITGQTLGPLQACRLHAHGHGLYMSKLVPASSPPAGPSKATLPPHTSGQTPGPCAFKGVQACRLPGLKPFKCFRRPFQMSPLAEWQHLCESYGRYLSSAHAGRLYDMGIQALQFYNASAWEALWATPSPSWNWGPVPNIEPTSPTNGWESAAPGR